MAANMSSPLDRLNSESFREHLHTNFQVRSGGSAPLNLELISVNEPLKAANMEIFSLHFRGPRAPVLVQQIWDFEHPQLGSLPMFMTAIASDQDGTTYEVVFNRILKQKS